MLKAPFVRKTITSAPTTPTSSRERDLNVISAKLNRNSAVNCSDEYLCDLSLLFDECDNIYSNIETNESIQSISKIPIDSPQLYINTLFETIGDFDVKLSSGENSPNENETREECSYETKSYNSSAEHNEQMSTSTSKGKRFLSHLKAQFPSSHEHFPNEKLNKLTDRLKSKFKTGFKMNFLLNFHNSDVSKSPLSMTNSCTHTLAELTMMKCSEFAPISTPL